VGTGQGAHAGVLIRNAEALELLGRVDTLVVDKTGTLTEGRPDVAAIEPAAGAPSSEADLLRLGAAVERGSEHPIAAAIVKAAERRGIPIPKATDFEAIAGKGVRARVDGHRVTLGTAALLGEMHVDPGPLAGRAEALRRDGQTVLLVAVDDKAAGLIGVADPIRPTTRDAIDRLRADGIRIVMVTG